MGSRLVPLHFDIDPHGRVAPGDDVVRRTLADRAGRFLLLPSVPDLLVARRTPSAGGPATGMRCILAGDLCAFPVADFIGFLHGANLSGTLTVSAGGVDRAVVFKDGEVRGAVSEGPGERIGEVALRLGFVKQAQLEAALGAAAGRPFGKVLVEMGFIAPADLWKSFHEQVAGVFHAILQAREGVFALVDQGDLELPPMPLAVNTQQLLMDGIRRLDEMGLFRSRIPGPSAFLRRRQPRRPVALKPLEEKLLQLVDGRRRLSDIAREAHLSEFDATKVLFHLAEAGYVEAVADPVVEVAADPDTRLGGIASGMNAIYRTVVLQVSAAGSLEPFLAAVKGFLADPLSPHAPLWKGLAMTRDGALEVPALLGNAASLRGPALARLEPSGDPARFLFDAMRELLFFLLFQAGERLGRDADEALSSEVKRRLEALGGLR
jgi:hypothetical protein